MENKEIIDLYKNGYCIEEIIDICIKNIRLKKIDKLLNLL